MIDPKTTARDNDNLREATDLLCGVGSALAFTVIGVCAIAALAGAAFLIMSFWF